MTNLPPPGSTVEQVLPGNPDDLNELAGVLDNYVDGAIDAARHLRALDSGGWVGEAADAFRSSVEDILKRLEDAAMAFEEASLALRSYCGALRDAQADVRRALSLLEEADTESRGWGARNAEALVANLTSPYTGNTVPVSPDDLGESLRRQAGTILAEAKGRVVAAAKHAADRLHTAADHAPDKPGFWQRRWRNVTEFAGGAVEATTGMATFAFKLSPAYELINPEGYVENLTGMAKGLAYGATHPVEFAKAVVDWETWVNSPGRALGHLLPLVALTALTGGTAAAGDGAEAVEAAVAMEEVGAERGANTAATLSELTPEDLVNRTPEELRNLARDKGFEPHGQPDADGNLRKFRDPGTKRPRLRIDKGHVDPTTGLPYNDPRAAVPHVHGYDSDAKPIVDPKSGNKHFPLRERFSE
jgi:uncharacterized protein YukE